MHRTGPILVALELGEGDRPLLDAAATYARALAVKVYLVHVVPIADEEFIGTPKSVDAEAPPGEPEVGYAYDRTREAGRAWEHHGSLQAVRAELERQGLDVTALQVAGPPGEKIVQEARRLEARLIIAGHRSRSALGEMVFGSTSKEILAGAPCPVLLIPEIQ